MEDALRVRAAYSIYHSVVKGMMVDKAKYQSRALYNEVYQQDQVVFSTYHLVYYTVWAARHYLTKSKIQCSNLRKNLESLVLLYGLIELGKDSAALYDCGYFGQGSGVKVTEGIKSVTEALRPQYIGLVESFDIPDNVLNTAVGNSYGDIYE